MENRRQQDTEKQTNPEQQQPYDNVLKLLWENQERLIMFNDLFEDDPFIQEKKAEGRAEGLAEGLQTAVVIVIKGRFPSLVPLAEQRVKYVNKPDVLNMLLLQVSKAEDENLTRFLLETTPAA